MNATYQEAHAFVVARRAPLRMSHSLMGRKKNAIPSFFVSKTSASFVAFADEEEEPPAWARP